MDKRRLIWVASFCMAGLFLSLMGVHNIDTAFNMRAGEMDIGLNWSQRPTLEIYFSGIKMVIIGVTLLLIAPLISESFRD